MVLSPSIQNASTQQGALYCAEATHSHPTTPSPCSLHNVQIRQKWSNAKLVYDTVDLHFLREARIQMVSSFDQNTNLDGQVGEGCASPTAELPQLSSPFHIVSCAEHRQGHPMARGGVARGQGYHRAAEGGARIRQAERLDVGGEKEQCSIRRVWEGRGAKCDRVRQNRSLPSCCSRSVIKRLRCCGITCPPAKCACSPISCKRTWFQNQPRSSGPLQRGTDTCSWGTWLTSPTNRCVAEVREGCLFLRPIVLRRPSRPFCGTLCPN